MPPPGTWAQVGEQIHYPDGHFCQQAMARLDTIAVDDLDSEYYPGAQPGEHGGGARGRADLGDRRAAATPGASFSA